MKDHLFTLFKLSLITIFFIWPFTIIWLNVNERMWLKLEECDNYRGNVQAFLRECEVIENDFLLNLARELWVEMKEFQWSPFLAILFIEPLYKLTRRLMRVYHNYQDGRMEKKYGPVKREASLTEFIRRGNHDKISLSS